MGISLVNTLRHFTSLTSPPLGTAFLILGSLVVSVLSEQEAAAARVFLRLSPTARIQYSTKPKLVPTPAGFADGYVFQDPSRTQDATVLVTREKTSQLETSESVKRVWKSESEALAKQFQLVRDFGCVTLSMGLHRCDIDYADKATGRSFASSVLFNRAQDRITTVAESGLTGSGTRELLRWYKLRVKLRKNKSEVKVTPRFVSLRKGKANR